MKIAITGASGLIGSTLATSLRGAGHEVLRLGRRGGTPPRADGPLETVSTWAPDSADGQLEAAAFAGVTAVVHLAGAGIADKRWTDERKAELRSSRVDATRALATGLAQLPTPPAALLCGSAIGWYGDTGAATDDEDTPAGTGFLADLVRDWEAAADPARAAGIRTVHLRTGIVLSGHGGTLGKLAPIFKAGLGLPLGDGRQYMSWISLADEVGAIRFLLEQPDVAGPVNLTGPDPVTNAEFTDAMNEALGHPTVLRLPVPGLRMPTSLLTVPSPVISLAMGEMAGEVLASAKVMPRRLREAGYAFQHPRVLAALSWALS